MSDMEEVAKIPVPATVWNEMFALKGAYLCPQLCKWICKPRRLVKFQKDEMEYFKVKPIIQNTIQEFQDQFWGKDDEFILDFGIHMVGFLSFQLGADRPDTDAPCRLRLTFGESPIDVTESMEDVKTWISTSWLPDETINVDYFPEQVTLSRRYSFRFLRVQVVDTSPKYKVNFKEIQCQAVSKIGLDHEVENFEFPDPMLQALDDVSIYTLRDCMQTVFEDGPRRDRRLWIGDIRLQALTNYSTFKDFALVKRCLYLFAAMPREDSSLPACLFEKPKLYPSSDYIVSYDILYAAMVYDYVAASGDLSTGLELWPTVEGCLKAGLAHLDPRTYAFDSARFKTWKFLDWAPGLHTSAGLHGTLLYTLRRVQKLAELLGIQPTTSYTEIVTYLVSGANHFLKEDNISGPLVVSGPENQVSLASAAWLTLACAFPPATARTTLLNALSHPNAVRPLTPYLWHYVCEALASVGCYQEATDLLTTHWGGMIRAGADTFWECFDPKDPRASPYGDVRNNSFCHAWSCTPSYLLRGLLREYVGGKRVGMVKMGALDDKWKRRTCGDIRDVASC